METTKDSRTGRRSRAFVYWFGVAVLLVFGFLAIFSIGAPFFLLGLTLVVLARSATAG